jgi:hypothetical protein
LDFGGGSMSAARIDFLHPRRLPWLGVGLLLLGGAAMATALWVDQTWAKERAVREDAERARLEAVDRARREALRPAVLTPDQLRLQRIAPVLRQPWLPTLRLIENATEAPVYLLALSVDPASGVVQLEAEAPDFSSALAYVKSLDEDGLLGPAQLRSHEQGTDPNRPTVRFKVATRWSGR